MKELYEKVYIRSEADLPKEDEFYVFCFKNGIVQGMNFFHGDSIDVWNNCNWYLRPVEQLKKKCNSCDAEMYLVEDKYWQCSKCCNTRAK